MPRDRMTDVAQPRARTHRGNPLPHRLIGGLHQPPRRIRHLAHQIRCAGVGDIAILFQRDIQIDDLPAPQHVRGRGHAMAHHIIDRGIEHEGEVVLPLAGRPRAQLVDNHPLDEVVEFQRAAACQRQLIQRMEHLRQQRTGVGHQRNLRRLLDHVRAGFRDCGRTPAARSSCATMSWNEDSGCISHSMPTLIQKVACALIDRLVTVHARRS